MVFPDLKSPEKINKAWRPVWSRAKRKISLLVAAGGSLRDHGEDLGRFSL